MYLENLILIFDSSIFEGQMFHLSVQKNSLIPAATKLLAPVIALSKKPLIYVPKPRKYSLFLRLPSVIAESFAQLKETINT